MIHFELALNGLFGMSVPIPHDSPIYRHGSGCLGLYGALQKDDIALKGAPTKLTATGAAFADGSKVDLDAIVYATGHAAQFCAPFCAPFCAQFRALL